MPVSSQGITRERYMVLPRVLIFITRGNRVLLIKGAPNKPLWANLYNGLGGHVEKGEDILAAAKRELLEESGLTADLYLCGTVLLDSGKNPGVGIYVFLGQYKNGDIQKSDEGDLEWVLYSDVDHLPAVEDLPVLINRIKDIQPGENPFSARSYYDQEGKLHLVFNN